MTQFKDLELLYKQFVNLTGEIDELIKEEDYENAVIKVESKTKLTKRLALAKKTTKLTDEQTQILTEIENQINEIDQKQLLLAKNLHAEVAKELEKTKGKVKINTAYAGYLPEEHGKIVDFTE